MRLARNSKGLAIGVIALCYAGLWAQGSAQAQGDARAPAVAPQRSVSSVRFEANQGQLDESVRFLARGNGYGLYLTPEGATLSLQPSQHGREPAVVRMSVVGAGSVQPSGVGEQAGRSNYFVGDDPSKWRTGVPAYARVIYAGVLPGVDMIYYGTSRSELEYDFVLGPGADSDAIELQLSGVESLELDAAGDAVLHLGGGRELRQRQPIAYQLDEQGRRVAVQARYELRANGNLGFVVRGHDPRRSLVIDPILSYGTFLGAGNYDELFGVATDAAGHTYVAGYTTGGLFPTSTPEQPLYAGGASDAVVCKINPAGSGFVYSTYLGGNNADQAYAVAADASGGAYVVGVTYSTNFPTVTPYQAAHAGATMADGFVTKLNSNGSALAYSTYLGGAADDFPKAIAVGPSGNAYVAGVTFSAGFPVAFPFQSTLAGTSDAFVTQLTPAGNALAYSTFLGGSGTEYGNGLATTPTGEVFVVGSTDSNNFPLAGAYQASRAGGTDAFVSKLSSSAALVYSTYLGGTFTDHAFAVAHSNGDAIVVGSTTSNNFPTVAAAQPTLASTGLSDAFVTSFTTPGTGLLFSTYLGGSGSDTANAVATDAQKNVYVVGSTGSTNFPLLTPLSNQESFGGGSWDGFFTSYRVSGVRAFSSYLGGDNDDRAVGIATHSGPDAHIAANTLSPDFPTQAPLPNLGTLRGSQDGFVLRSPILNNPSAVPATNWLTVLLTSGLLLGSGLLLLGSLSGQAETQTKRRPGKLG